MQGAGHRHGVDPALFGHRLGGSAVPADHNRGPAPPRPRPSSPGGRSSGGGGSGGAGGGGGGGGPAIGIALPTHDIYIRSISWDCQAGTVGVVAGPNSQDISVSVRTTHLGYLQAARAG